MFEIDRNHPWPPGLKLTSARATLKAMEQDMKRVPQLAEVARALKTALHAIDQAEAKSPRRLGDGVVTHSRFIPASTD